MQPPKCYYSSMPVLNSPKHNVPLSSAYSGTVVPPAGGCPPGQFQCVDTGQCILEELMCDGQPDCSDASDEAGDDNGCASKC